MTTDLFGQPVPGPPTRDPGAQKKELCAWLYQWNGEPLTPREIAEKTGFDFEMIHKRLPDLEREGYVRRAHKRRCEVTGMKVQTWAINPLKPVQW